MNHPQSDRRPQFLLGAVAYNPHVQNMAQALHDAGALYRYASAGIDAFHGPLHLLRNRVGGLIPSLHRELGRRTVRGVPEERLQSRWRWELPRVVGARLGVDERLVDWVWERSELDFDRSCVRMIRRDVVDGYVGVEHGALASLTEAKRLGKPSVLAFLSPHYRTFEQWVVPEYARFPDLMTPRRAYFAKQAPRRHQRVDHEAATADWIVTNSTFTTKSLVDAGIEPNRILTVRLGGPTPVCASALPASRPARPRFVYVGPVSVRKGAHYLLSAWRTARPQGELHFYGEMLLPEKMRREATAYSDTDSIVFHGSVPATELRQVYLDASALVLPTLCDGFGMVVSEALAHGLPVITTSNAGAADAIEQGRTGFVIPPASAEALASALTWCVDHMNELFAMRHAALQAAARWTWSDYRRSFADAVLSAVRG